ncbi:MAG: hypothetical protein DRJ62_07265, partial [Thermoprotei archaeon]
MAVVTGGAGFIGSHLVERLLEEGFQVKVLDDFSYGSMDNLKSVEGSVEVHVVDVSKREQVKPLLKDVDVV